jgi:hypothetical protein
VGASPTFNGTQVTINFCNGIQVKLSKILRETKTKHSLSQKNVDLVAKVNSCGEESINNFA